MGFIIRWAVAFILVAATYNPTPWNYLSWASQNFSDQLPLTVLFGLILFIGYIIYLRATLRSIGLFGMILIMAVISTLIWVLFDQGLIGLQNQSMNIWIAVFAVSLMLAVGLSWSIVRRRLTGQTDVDDIDD